MISTIFSDPRLLDEIDRYSKTKKIPKDAVLLSTGDDIVYVPIVLEGVLRIVRQNEEGKEVFLYHIYQGQTCAMVIGCCMTQKRSMIKAIAEEDTKLLLVPANLVDEWTKYPQWKTYVNTSYALRFGELIEVIDLIAFSNMDAQVMHYLQERAKASHSRALFITHQQIADELHTHREAISRLLRNMEEKKLVKLGRNSIELISA